jgi:ribulose kinase
LEKLNSRDQVVAGVGTTTTTTGAFVNAEGNPVKIKLLKRELKPGWFIMKG